MIRIDCLNNINRLIFYHHFHPITSLPTVSNALLELDYSHVSDAIFICKHFCTFGTFDTIEHFLTNFAYKLWIKKLLRLSLKLKEGVWIVLDPSFSVKDGSDYVVCLSSGLHFSYSEAESLNLGTILASLLKYKTRDLFS